MNMAAWQSVANNGYPQQQPIIRIPMAVPYNLSATATQPLIPQYLQTPAFPYPQFMMPQYPQAQAFPNYPQGIPTLGLNNDITTLLVQLLSGLSSTATLPSVQNTNQTTEFNLSALLNELLTSSNNYLETTTANTTSDTDITALLTELLSSGTSTKQTAATDVDTTTRATTQSTLLTEAQKLLSDSKLSSEDLKGLKGATAHTAYNTIANKLLGWDIPDVQKGNHNTYYSLVVKDGPFKGRRMVDVSVKDLADAGYISDFNLPELEKELGVKGSTGNDGYTMRVENLAQAKKYGIYNGKAMALSEAQKYLNEAKKIEAQYGIGSSSGSSSSVSCSEEELESAKKLSKDLREKAKDCVETSVVSHSPIILDEDGNQKIDLTSAEDGVQFDLNGDGQKEQVAWSQAKGEQTDSWLTLDRNGNGTIDSGKELFGDQFGESTGYKELAKFDSNADGKIDNKDAIFSQLRTWKDKNHDGISQADELLSLKDAGVESINTGFTESTEKDAVGNELRQQSSFTRTDAKATELANASGKSVKQSKTGLSVDAWLLQQ